MGLRFQFENCPRWNSHILNRAGMTEPQSSTLSPPIDDVLNLYFHRLESAMGCTAGMIAVEKNLVCSSKQDDTSNETLLHEMSVLSPQHGSPSLAAVKRTRNLPSSSHPISIVFERNDTSLSLATLLALTRRSDSMPHRRKNSSKTSS